jgi:hypothetical protein
MNVARAITRDILVTLTRGFRPGQLDKITAGLGDLTKVAVALQAKEAIRNAKASEKAGPAISLIERRSSPA